MKATKDDLLTVLNTRQSISEPQLSSALNAADRFVQADGFYPTDVNYADLHCYYSAHLLQVRGIIEQDVASKSVGDVSTSYANQAQGESRWLNEYNRLSRKLRGLNGRFA